MICLLVTCEFPAGVSPNVLLPDDMPPYSEGAEIIFQCMPGFQPQENITTLCGSNGLWSPDPTLHNCTGKRCEISLILVHHYFICVVDCGVPVFPSSGTVNAETNATTEGATVSFECEEGLLPSGSNSTNIQCRNSNDMGRDIGQWIPDPATLVCRTQGKHLCIS